MTAALAGALLQAQIESIDPATIGRAPVKDWPTFNGDYSGQRFSTLTQINRANLNRLELQWAFGSWGPIRLSVRRLPL